MSCQAAAGRSISELASLRVRALAHDGFGLGCEEFGIVSDSFGQLAASGARERGECMKWLALDVCDAPADARADTSRRPTAALVVTGE